MDLDKEILLYALMHSLESLTIPSQNKAVAQIVEGVCYRALEKIKAIIQDDSLVDPECFMKIEEIICVLEEIGSSGGIRHDFG